MSVAIRVAAAACCALGLGVSPAQPAPPAAPAASSMVTSIPPAGAGRVELPRYRSAFAGYRGFDDQAVQPWRATNDIVERIGGWRTYAREAAGQEPAATPGPIAARPDAPGVDAPTRPSSSPTNPMDHHQHPMNHPEHQP